MIKTERCTLRRFEEKDLDGFIAYRNDDEWMKYQSFKNLSKDEYREKLLVPLELESGVQLAIASSDADNLMGDLYVAKEGETIYIGYAINPQYARKGYIFEVLNTLLPKLKAFYPECEIVAETDRDNLSSKNLLLKLGFEYDGWFEAWASEVFKYKVAVENAAVDVEDFRELFKSNKRNFDILLIGGASGVGKSCVSYALSEFYEMNVVQVDDFQCIVEHFTKEEDYPVFHYWKNHFEEAVVQPIEKKLEIMINYANTLSKALELVINNHLEENRPMILEGDFISPELCKKLLADGEIKKRVKCVFILEDDQAQIVQNYHAREGTLQAGRAELSWRYNNWIKEQVAGTEIIIVPAMPWETSANRICRLLNQ